MEIPLGDSDLNFSESLNNPGNLSDLTNDTYALGKINNLNVYKSAEEGIAALCYTLERIQLAGARSVAEIISSFVDIVGNLVRTKTSYVNLRKAAYLEDVKNIWGIDAEDVIDLHNPSTKIIMAIIITELVQKRNIYSYSQFVKGCALAANMDVQSFEKRVSDSSLSIESSKSAGFNSPASASIVKGGSSLSNSTSSNYKQVGANFLPKTAKDENPLYIKSINYGLKNSEQAIEYSFPASEQSTSLPAVLVNLGFRQNKIIGGEVVYLNDAGDKARKLGDQTYLITYVDGSPDEVVKSAPTFISLDYEPAKNLGALSNSYSVERQKTRLEKRISFSEKSNYPVTAKPLSTAYTILAAYRFR